MRRYVLSAGIMYFYLRGVLEENNQISIYVQDTYKCLPDAFYKNVSFASLEEDDGENVVHVFGVIGASDKINAIAEVVKTGIQGNCQRIINGKSISKSNSKLDELGNVYYKLIQEFVCEAPNHFPYEYNESDEEWSLNCIWSSNATESIAYSLASRTIDIWIEEETPAIIGKQILTRSFFMSDFVSRKAIACVPNRSTGDKTLLFEGGNALNLDRTSFYKGVSSPRDLGFFTASGINNILLTPAYAFAEHLYPNDISLEWHKVFLFACAVSDIKWNEGVFYQIYIKFLGFLKANICCSVDVESFISRQMSYGAFLINIDKVRGFLAGEDEPVISKDLFQLLNTRYVYLPHLFNIIKPKYENSTPFSAEILCKQIDVALNAVDTYKKGVLWEDAAKYVLDHIDGWRVTGRRVRAGSQEIDLSVANVSLDDELWQLGSYILVECKNWKKHVDVPQIRNMAYISAMKGNKTALLFTSNGITRDARMEIERLAGTGIYVIAIDSNDLKNMKRELDCKAIILNKYRELLEISKNDLQL